VNPFDVLRRHYDPGSPLYDLLLTHSVLVAQRAREIARSHVERHPGAGIDLRFLLEAALLHDIGIGGCDAPEIHCTGSEPYIRHGVLGREILEQEGLDRHALVCERHTGAGITREEVVENRLPLPERDYLPLSLEEKIICVADKFYSKSPGKLWDPKTPEAIRRSLGKWGPQVLARWDSLVAEVME
jgi:uncharacterized protein